ncbi:PTS sugar transporter subunit IIA [Sporanaerobacter acetigenes]|uniref:PTS sugar transporter subunit IIA n=1 Tax=Sporanaerobacter acetigenes TaxID=165813 RepID=UPI00331EBED7
MIGFIILGHNKFGSGLKSSMDLILGEQDKIETIDFLPEDGVDMLDKKISEGLKKLKDCDYIIMFADLLGGSPFNRAMIASTLEGENNIHVISGTNLTMVVEAVTLRDSSQNIDDFISSIINTGKDGIKYGNDLLKDTLS